MSLVSSVTTSSQRRVLRHQALAAETSKKLAEKSKSSCSARENIVYAVCQSDSGTTSLQLKARRHQAEPMVANSIFVCGMSCHAVGTEPAVEPTCRKPWRRGSANDGRHKLLRKIHATLAIFSSLFCNGACTPAIGRPGGRVMNDALMKIVSIILKLASRSGEVEYDDPVWR